MAFLVEITPIAEAQIEQAYQWYRERNPEFADRWFRSLMNAIATLQENPPRCALSIEHEIFLEEVRQLLHGKNKKHLSSSVHHSRVYGLCAVRTP